MLIDSPNIPTPFFIKHFSVLDQKNLAYFSKHDKHFFHFFLHRILKEKIELLENDFNKLNILDYFIILLQYRAVYVGNSITFETSCSCGKNAHIVLDISDKLEEIDQLFNIDHSHQVKYDDITVTFDVPKITDLSSFVRTHPLEWLTFFITSFNDIDLNTLDYENRKTIIDSLPYDTIKQLENKFLDFLKLEIPKYIFQKCLHCKHEEYTSFKFLSIFDILQSFLFNFNYDQCLLEHAIIAKKLNISPEYIEKISVVEKQKYIDIVEEQSEKITNDKNEVPTQLNSEFGF
jgi:hypothetical protein